VHPVVEPLARLTAVLGFEPDPEECRRLLADPAVAARWAAFELEPTALADRTGPVALHYAAVATNHSLLPTHTPFVERYAMTKFERRGATTVAATTLDDVLYGRRPDDTHLGEFIKLDTQGSEWEILDGAQRCLSERCVAVYSEVWFCQAYANVKQFSEVELLLRAHGFSFYGFPVWRGRSRRRIDKRTALGRERPFCVDAVFLKDPMPGGPATVALAPRQWRVLFTCALLLGYADFALELAEAIWAGTPDMVAAAHRLVHDQAAADPAAAASDALALAERVRRAPERALIDVGRFADRRRTFWDYDDVVDG
jgi:FkbM family methyltransferase